MADFPAFDSATRLGASARGQVVVCASHGGLYAAWLAARAGVRAVILNDAGIGRDLAGIAGVKWLARLGIAACAVDHRSARIADAADMLACGVISTVNETAAENGCLPGQPCLEAARCLEHYEGARSEEVPEIGESRTRIRSSGHRAVWALDSVALVEPGDRRAIVVTGSHGALLGGREDDGILGVDVHAAFFNDAGVGKDEAGVQRLGRLDARGIAAAAVSCQSARIGDGLSTYETGALSRVNATAVRLGLAPGMSAREAVARLVGLA